MQLDRIFFKNIFRSFLILCLIFLPILYLSDCFFAEDFSPLSALAKLPMRYGQSIGNLLLWGSWLGVKNVRKKYGDEVFVSMGFRLRDSWRVIFGVSFICMAIDGLILIPSNEYLEPEIVANTNWAIKEFDGNTIFVYDKGSKELFDYRLVFDEIRGNFCDSENYKIFSKDYFHDSDIFVDFVKKNLENSRVKVTLDEEFRNIEAYWISDDFPLINNGIIKGKKVYIESQNGRLLTMNFYEKDFYNVWNEPKKLSWSGLRRCKSYLDYQKLDSSDIIKQKYNYITRIVMLIGMVVCGVVFGFKNGIGRIFFCAVGSCWLIQVTMFMPLTESIFAMWANGLGWIFWGLWYFL